MVWSVRAAGSRRLSAGITSLWRLSQSSLCARFAVRYYASAHAVVSSDGPRKARGVTVEVKDLPQGVLPLEPLQDGNVGAEGYPTVIQQARDNMRKFDHCVVLTRVGNFYELYFEQAEEFGPLLGLKVAAKKISNGRLVPMAGFPFFQLDRFLKLLVQDHAKHVAIAEEMANDPAKKVKVGGLLFNRQVRRVITPGTLIDEQFLNPYEHNYLLAIEFLTDSADQPRVGLSWIDLSSGDFFTQSTDPDSLATSIARIRPREVILHQSLTDRENPDVAGIAEDDGLLISYFQPSTKALPVDEWMPMLEETASTIDVNAFTNEEIVSTSLLLQYVQQQLPGLRLRLQSPTRRQAEEYMNIDKNSLRGLEVVRTLRDGSYKGSLLQAVRRTSTESGARLLVRRLTSPSMSTTVINDRLDLVEFLLNSPALLEQLITLLRRTADILRLIQKFSFGKGDADDLLALSSTINITRQVSDTVAKLNSSSQDSLQQLLDRFRWEGPIQVAARVRQAIDEEGLMLRQRSQEAEAAETADMARSTLESNSEAEGLGDLQKRLNAKRFSKPAEGVEDRPSGEEIWIMRRHASETLARLHDSLEALKQEKVHLCASLQERLGASTLTLRFTPGLGHICHVKGKDTKIDMSALENARTVGASKSTRSFYLPDWTRLGGKIEDAKLRIRGEEQNIFQSLRDDVIKNLVPLRRNAAILDELDLGCSFATLAAEYGLKRPKLNHSCDYSIWGGRHIMVDAGLVEAGRQFTPNHCFLNEEERIWLITGPNMAGKSTFLRQTALISILAQTGSFVPADYAEIGLVDQIFTRVGSADNVSQDQSTFMVEMLETAHILRHATERSFVIMDEVGRGTTPEDGIAVGYAVLDHLQRKNRCRTLFATHFHALADMTKTFKGLACYCTDVNEELDGSFMYDHRLRKGVNRASHALKVARLAGVPEEAVQVASGVLERLKDEPTKV